MYRVEWRVRWQQLRDMLRPEPKGAPPSRVATVSDAVLAVVLTLLALASAHRPSDTVVHVDPRVGDPPAPPEPPEPPPPGVVFHHTPWLLTVLTVLPLVARRRYPLVVFWIVMFAAQEVRDGATLITVLAYVIAAYSAIAYSRYRAQATASLVLAAVLAGVAFRHTDPSLPGWSGPFFVLLVAGVVATLIRSWQRRLRASQLRLTELQRTQEEATRQAVELERARIAAELHDVVTHNVSVMVIQTGAARKVMDAEPELSKEAMLSVEASGRAALSELRHVMGLLSATDDERPDGLEPQPGLDRLDGLIEGVRAAGVPVNVAVSTPPGSLPPGVDLTAYRVVQEALTNTIKHAVGATATVTIGYDGDWLEIEVADTGGTPGAGAGAGRGLIGLRERLAVYGGTLETGRRLPAGFRLSARLPWTGT
ncbi:histidine kinase [Actinomadura sp. DC4]|uniref:sensor histidine kinase n=1 Tax=Actinomadura sp. DC4 TaxID=3055069 RepID=UPI0025B04912|nr:histidine kinase [Actinomadura sp. DC4]MDN3358689.1 histidine kinase [Actinomadura sp. DC4]